MAFFRDENKKYPQAKMNNWEEELKKILSGLDKIPDDGTLEEMDDEMQIS